MKFEEFTIELDTIYYIFWRVPQNCELCIPLIFEAISRAGSSADVSEMFALFSRAF